MQRTTSLPPPPPPLPPPPPPPPPPLPPPPAVDGPASSFARQLRRAASKIGVVYVTVTDRDGRDQADDTPPPQPGRHDERRLDSSSAVDFVLAYQKHRKIATKVEGKLVDDDSERLRFFRELQAREILVYIDDDPTCSLDAGRTCFVLLRLSERLLGCKCNCHAISGSNGGQTEANTKNVSYKQCPNNDGNYQEHCRKFTSAQRAQIVWRIILRIGFDNKQNKPNVMSLEKLLETGIINDAYPVHDGNIKLGEGDDPNNINDRQILYEKWARPGLIIPRQWKSDEKLTTLIQKYYGIPVAVYFCWLRYYTIWLLGPAIAGLAWFLYGLMTTRNDVPTQDICDPKSQVANWVLCPTRPCDANYCGFTRVLDTCDLYRWTSAATFDRPGAVVFTVFMSLWATAFQQLWTTYGWQMDERCEPLEHDGGGECCVDCRFTDQSSNDEPSESNHLRAPENHPPPPMAEKSTFASPGPYRSPTVSLDVLRRWFVDTLSASFRVFVFVVTLVAVTAIPILIVVYRGRAIGWLMTAVFHQDSEQSTARAFQRRDAATVHRHKRHNFFLLNYTNSGELSNWKTAVAALCATVVQLTAIVSMHYGYNTVAKWLTRYSYRSVYDPRFQSRYTIYMSCFDSANYYSSLVYIAFFKGRFMTEREQYTDGSGSKFTNFWPVYLFRSLVRHVREDVCDPSAAGSGCVPELCTQLAIIMVAKQLVDNAIELTTPLAINVWRRWRAKEIRRRKKFTGELPDTVVETLKHPKQWQLDYQLEDTGQLGLYQEYSEMVIQYGFVVMFATVFPLAPLCALLNNVLEQRLDAYKMVAAQRRPVPAYYCTVSNRQPRSSCCDNCIKLVTWTRVLKVLSVISILYNAFMIAFTSDLLPRHIYTQMSSDASSSLDGYIAWSLSSKRNVTEYYYGRLEDVTINNKPETCRYQGYGADSDTSENFRQWQVLAARLTFVIVFEHCVIAFIMALAYIIRKTVYKIKNRTEKFNKLPSEILSSPVVNSSDNAVHNNNIHRDVIDTENIFTDKTNDFDENPTAPESTKIVMVDMEVISDEDTQDSLSRRHQHDKNENLTDLNGISHRR